MAATETPGSRLTELGPVATDGRSIDDETAFRGAWIEFRTADLAGHGPHRIGPLVSAPRSTVCAVLPRAGYSRLRDADRRSGVPVRYVRGHPVALVHPDHKKLGRTPTGGSHRARHQGDHRRAKSAGQP